MIIKDVTNNGGIIIDKPWIDKILSGEKTWEMRSNNCRKRGYIALVRKGSKQIVGVAKIEGCEGPLDEVDLKRSEQKHRVSPSVYAQADYKWRYAIKLSNVFRLTTPVSYQHKNGWVIWTRFQDQPETLKVLKRVLRSSISVSEEEGKTKQCNLFNATESKEYLSHTVMKKSIQKGCAGKVPKSASGRVFCNSTSSRDGLFHIKGLNTEYRFDSEKDALSLLRRKPTFQWAYFDKRGIKHWQSTKTWHIPEK